MSDKIAIILARTSVAVLVISFGLWKWLGNNEPELGVAIIVGFSISCIILLVFSKRKPVE
jgi:hypothetical protein